MKRYLFIACLALTGVTGCATNPVTGENELMLVSESQELSIGKQQYAPMRQAQGGDYVVDPGVEAYISQVGQRLARKSDRPLPYEFTVLNNSTPNAWALPGGKIAINRGLLTELDSEAELAAVLGHEIVHAAAKHGAKGMQRGLLLQGAVIAATIATQDKQYANAAQLGSALGAQLINQKYGRDAEREADLYGMRYMSRAGYDTQGAVELQKTFVQLTKERRQDWLSGLFASHPASQERVSNNIATAATLPPGGETGEEAYRRKVARLVKTKPAYEAYDKAKRALSDDQKEQANALVRKAIAIEPREGHFHSLLGDIAQAGKRYKSAKAHYSKAISLNDNFFYYYLQRGLVNEKLKSSTSAKQDLDRSINLLPTADAYNALGNIARGQRQFATAKDYYAKAAESQSKAGQAAFASLVDLDLADQPGKYLRLGTGLDRSGTLVAKISNPTPRNVTGIVLALRYPDKSGQMIQLERPVRGQLAAGKTQAVNLGITLQPEQAKYLRAAIVAARIAK